MIYVKNNIIFIDFIDHSGPYYNLVFLFYPEGDNHGSINKRYSKK